MTLALSTKIEYISAKMVNTGKDRRRRSLRKADVPCDVLRQLAEGEVETRNLMEWLAADMALLARAVARQTSSRSIQRALEEAALQIEGQSILARLRIFGRALAAVVPSFTNTAFCALIEHRSDLVRQWACYAVNDQSISGSVPQRLKWTLPFAADKNMSVREAAWMAFRPHIGRDLQLALKLLAGTARESNPNLRRFAVEVTRPRSVWGNHIEELKEKSGERRTIVGERQS